MKRKYDNAEELQKNIDGYWNKCTVDEKPATYAGLAHFLGFASRQSLWEYSKRTDDLSLPIKMALLKIESEYEERLSGAACTGAIFALKNRGWTDKQEMNHTGEIKHKIKSWGDVMGGEGPEE